tara:strand:+ start:6385 stop:6720 length:336 start_codon:yes stop_codon:yes gene_type:complete
MKLNCSQKNMLAMVVVLLVAGYFVVGPGSGQKKSYYVLSPQDLGIVKKPNQPASIFDLPYKAECTPGPSAKGSYYTIGLNPGGICGDQAWVNGAMSQYKITSGLGGSLLDN